MNIKKVISIILITFFSLILISCGDKKEGSNTKDETATVGQNNQNEKKDTDTKENETKSESKNGDKSTLEKESKRQYYLDKLDEIQKGLSDLDSLYKGNTKEMTLAAEKELKRWDDELNEIYNVLKKQLNPTEMKKVQDEEVEWLSYRDNEAKKASIDYKGGTGESLAYTSSLGETTKKRCYELVEKYMK